MYQLLLSHAAAVLIPSQTRLDAMSARWLMDMRPRDGGWRSRQMTVLRYFGGREMSNLVGTLRVSILSASAICILIAVFALPRRWRSKAHEMRIASRRATQRSIDFSPLSLITKLDITLRRSTELEPLLKSTPDSFEVNELLGLVYVAQGKQQRAKFFLMKAVRSRPSVAEAEYRACHESSRAPSLE